MRVRLGLTAVLVSITILPLHAQLSDPQEIGVTLKINTDQVLTDVLITEGKHGTNVGVLTRDDLEIKEDGLPQSIQYFTRDSLPLSVVFLFDLTDTVRPVLKPLAAAARGVLDELRPQDEAAVMVFYSTTKILQPFTSDHELLAQAMETASTLKTREATFLNEVVFQACNTADHASLSESRRVLLFLTDGTSNWPTEGIKKTFGKSAPDRLHTESEAMDALAHSGAAVSALIERSSLTNFVLASSYISAGPLLNKAMHPGDIRKYAQESGGIVLNSSKNDVAKQMADLIEAMRSRYTLGYRPMTSATNRYHHLSLALTPHFYATHPELKGKALVIHTRAGYYR